MKTKIFFLSLVFLSLPILIYSQDNKKETTLENLYIDLSVPDLSAFTLLNIQPTNTVKPGNIKELSAALFNIYNISGKISPGIAVEWSPYLTFNKNKILRVSKNDIITNLDKFWRRLSFTLGSVEDSTSSKLSYGGKWVIIDKSDYLDNKDFIRKIIGFQEQILNLNPVSADKKEAFTTNYTKYIHDARGRNAESSNIISELNKIFDTPGLDKQEEWNKLNPTESGLREKINKINGLSNDNKQKLYGFANEYLAMVNAVKSNKIPVIEQLEEYIDNYKKNNWNSNALQIGVGQIFNSPDKSWKGIKSNYAGSYLNGALKMGNWGQGLLQITYNKYSADSAKPENSYSIGTRLLLGSYSFRFSLDYSFFQSKLNVTEAIEKNTKLALGIEFKVADGTWLELAVGNSGENLDLAKVFSLANFKYAFNKEQRFIK